MAEGAQQGVELIAVEVAYARLDVQVILPVQLPRGATVADALRESRITERFREIDLEQTKVGIFGKLTRMDAELQPKDRVEIYRPLIADPKEVRRQRAAQGKPTKKGGASAGESD